MIATLSCAIDAQWDQPVEIGADTRTETLTLRKGFAEIIVNTGAKIIVEGPCRLNLQSSNSVLLHEGQLVAHVGPEAVGFSVLSENARIIDHGTEFGVRVDRNGATDVAVFSDGTYFTTFRTDH